MVNIDLGLVIFRPSVVIFSRPYWVRSTTVALMLQCCVCLSVCRLSV